MSGEHADAPPHNAGGCRKGLEWALDRRGPPMYVMREIQKVLSTTDSTDVRFLALLARLAR